MRQIRILLILILCITMMACDKGKEYSKISTDFKILKSVGLDCVYEYNGGGYFLFHKMDLKKYDVTKRSYIDIRNCFFFDEKIACISGYYEVIYYDIEKRSIIKYLQFERKHWDEKKGHPYETVAIKKNSSYDIYIFSYGTLYDYNYNDDKLKIINDKFDELIGWIDKSGNIISPLGLNAFVGKTNYISGCNAPVYNYLRNSIIFSINGKDNETDKWGILLKEFSLEDFTIKDVIKGYRPYVVESKKLLYYIDADGYNIMQMDLDTLKNKKVLYKYNLPIYYFITNKAGDRIVFIHRNKYPVFDLMNWNFSEYRKSSEIIDKNSFALFYFLRFSDKFINIPSDLIFPEDFQKQGTPVSALPR